MGKFQKYFYLYGTTAFLLVALGSIYTAYIKWSEYFIIQKINFYIFFIFYCMLSYNFYTMYKNYRIMEEVPKAKELTDEEIKKLGAEWSKNK